MSIKNILERLNVTVYATPVDTDDTVVLLGRLAPINDQDKNLKLAEARLLNFIERALKSFEGEESVKARFSRPWLLKDGNLAFTWDFTFRGDLVRAEEILSNLAIPTNPTERVEESSIQVLKPKRGTVKAVTIGRLV